MAAYDVVALGEVLIDFAPHSLNEAGYPVLSANPGGAPGNFLAALAKYGCKTAIIGKVGDDAFGRLLRQTLTEAGIGTGSLLLDPGVFTTLAFVSLDASGNRDFSFARKPGAGDIFGGSAMSRLIRCGKAPSDLTEEELRSIVRFACTAASLSTQKHGGISSVPDPEDVERLLK